MNSPRFLVASDPDGEHFANSIVAVQSEVTDAGGACGPG